MRFAFTDEQLAFRDAVRELLEKECTPRHVRDAWTNETGRVPGLWEQLHEMGVVGMLAPEEKGGLGLTMVDLVLILEETGRHAVPEPIVETAASGVPVLGSDCIGLREVLRGTPSRTAPAGDADAWCRALQAALAAPWTRAARAYAAEARRRFAAEEAAARLLRLFDDLLARGGRRQPATAAA